MDREKIMEEKGEKKMGFREKRKLQISKKGGIREQKDEVMEIHFLKSSADSS